MKKYNIHALRKSTKKCFLIAMPLFMLWIASCDDMNSIHQKYYDWGEDIYTGVVDSLKAYGGYERVKFDWELNADPRITKTVIFWNQREDSVVMNINRMQSGRLQMTYQLENLSEGDYIFEFITRDDKGHFSMSKEVVVQIYGESYAQMLRNRQVSSISHREDGSMFIQWNPISNVEMQYVTIKYETHGVEQSLRVENDDTETVLTGLDTGDKIRVSTTYLPEDALDELHSPYIEYTMPAFERVINKANFSVVVLAGDNTSVSNGRGLSRIWDGATTSPGILHTIENAPGFNSPHHFTFDMGVAAQISRFRIWPRTEEGAFTGHSPKHFEIWGTNELKSDPADENYWTTDEWKADWERMGDHEIIRPESNQGAVWTAGWEYEVDENISRVRYIRLIVRSNWRGSNCVNIGEITLWGDDL